MLGDQSMTPQKYTMRKRSLLLYLVLRHVVCFQIMPRSRTMAVTVQNRREILDILLIGGAAIFSTPPPALAAEASKSELVASLQTARKQMDKIPDLIKAQQWDSVRAILITPPLSDLWGKKSEILLQYADVADDELAVLELKEDIQSHLRYLDMAVCALSVLCCYCFAFFFLLTYFATK